jgi:hypothetical protein
VEHSLIADAVVAVDVMEAEFGKCEVQGLRLVVMRNVKDGAVSDNLTDCKFRSSIAGALSRTRPGSV